MNKNAKFGGEIKSFVPHITETTTRHVIRIGRAWDEMGKNANIRPKMTKNAYFGPILAVLGLKS